jgi:hypothetical protein
MISELSSEPVREAVGAFQGRAMPPDAVGEPLTSAEDEQRMGVGARNTQAARGGPAMTCAFHSVTTPDGDLWRACWRAMEPSLVAKREKRL